MKNMVGFQKGIGTTKVEALASVEAYHTGGQKLQTYINTIFEKLNWPKRFRTLISMVYRVNHIRD